MQEPERDAWERYTHAADAVRWQVSLAETRAGRFMGFTALLLAAGLAASPGGYSALFFLLGAFSAVFSAAAMHTDHEYYRAVRATMISLAGAVDALAGKPVTPRATPGQGSGKWRLISVQWAQRFIMAAMFLVGIVGAMVSW